ncbi:hypothetical protein LJK88_43540 [Paenibacillus sp. P26]|nr:hypothetical protein LJK88_43540 [Paenibacillus sp. P26]UUZ97865.1 hypothetical protein LJK87_44755 [Paenibacillus sp. P25]
MFIRGFIVSALSVTLAYILLSLIHFADWWRALRNAEGHIQFMVQSVAAISISILLGPFLMKKSSNCQKAWAGYAAGLLAAPVLIGLLLIAYVLLTLAP